MSFGPDTSRWAREMTLFDAALDQAAERRAAFVAEAAGADVELRAAVEALLAAAADATDRRGARPVAALHAAAAARGVDSHRSGSSSWRREVAPELLGRLQEAVGPAYRIDRELGGGGMSRVFLAEDAQLGRRVVLKVLPPEWAHGFDVERFRQEVRLAATLRHPHIVPLLTAGESANGLFYFTMPYIEGESLRARLDREGPLPATDVACVVREVADALAYAHRRGVVHRDVKPANVLVDGAHVLVSDFGIAKALSDAGDGPVVRAHPALARGSTTEAAGTATGAALTARGFVLGTPPYMSPEQARGDAVDGRSDVYSLACMTFEMLTGERPAPGLRTSDGDRQAPHESAIDQCRPGLPAAVAAVIARARAIEPEARFQTADAFARALDGALAHEPDRPRRIRRAAMRVGGLVALAGLAAAVVGARWRATHASAVASRAEARRPPATSPSLAVLPFRNLGPASDEYFADGIAEEVVTRLARVSGLGVLAWTSTSRYKGASQPAADIGRELGAAYVLEGTVQWAPGPRGTSRVRVTPRLVRVADARQLWAEPYEAELADVFAIQAAVAERVAAALDVALLAPERRGVAERPTRNVAAYDSYLRGNALTTRGMTFVPQARRDAARWYEQAVALDPAFASAWARLAQAHLRLYLSRDDPTPSRLAQARGAAERAFAIDPTLPEASVALGQTSNRRWDAVEHYVLALRAHPSSTELLYALGGEQKSLGRRSDALASFTRAAALDPRSPDGPAEIANLYDEQRAYDDAIRVRERQIALDPGSAIAYVAQALSVVNARGDTAAARRILTRAVGAAGRASLVQMLARRSGVRVARVLWPALDASTRRALDTLSVAGAQAVPWRVYRLKAEHFERSGRAPLARLYHDSARVAVLAALPGHVEDPELHDALGLAYAGLGRASDALREGLRAVALDTAEAGSDDRPWTRFTLATIAARVDARDVALAALAAGLPTSGPAVSAYWFRLDPAWAPLRDAPIVRRMAVAAH